MSKTILNGNSKIKRGDGMDREVRIYKFDKKDYGKLKALVSKDQFARNGYTIRDAKIIGVPDFDGYYLYIPGDKEFFDAHGKEITDAGGKVVESSEYELVKDEIEKEEKNVGEGLSLFG